MSPKAVKPIGIGPISLDMRNQSNHDNDAAKPCIATHIGPRSLAPQTRAALEGLGYRVVPAFAMGQTDDLPERPRLRLVDERFYDEMPSLKEDPQTPIIVLTDFRPQKFRDARIVGSVCRPAELNDLYPILQSALETTPRTSPRVSTALAARCVRADRRWMGSVVSLSDRGCLFHSRERVADGAQMNLQFALPSSGIITTRAVCIHQGEDAAGLIFSDPSTEDRQVIGGFVLEQLAIRSATAQHPQLSAPPPRAPGLSTEAAKA